MWQWCCNGHWSFSFHNYVAATMRVLDVGYNKFKAQKNLYAVRVDVSLTQVTDFVAAMDPLFDPLGIICPFDEVIFATGAPDTGPHAVPPTSMLSRFPEFVVLIETGTTSDLLMEGLAEAKIFGVYCNPVIIGLRYP